MKLRTRRLVANAKRGIPPPGPNRIDPSRTATLRRAFAAELRRRLARLKLDVANLIDGEDAFGLKPASHDPFALISNAGRWQFLPSAERITAFRAWLRDRLTALFHGPGPRDIWRRYVEEGFRKGAGRAFDDTHKRRFAPGEGQFYQGSKEQFLRSAFGQPVAVEKVQLLVGRVFTDLEGVTEAMATAMTRTLADGLVQGKGPRDVARDLARNVDGIGKVRAEAIAQTELVRAHAEGQLTAFEQLGVEEVGAAVEWSTTGDGKVCPACRPLQGVVLTVEEARGMLPRHPRCRCAWTPRIEPGPGEKATKAKIDAAIRASQKKGGGEWGPAVPIGKERPTGA